MITVDKQKHIKAYEANMADLCKNLDYFLGKTRQVAQDFGGPSIYFHKEAINESRKDFLGGRHLDMIYAMLPSWGMHRMGNTNTKVVEYDDFINQISSNKDVLFHLYNKNMNNVDIHLLSDLLINKLHISISNARLVSSSKVLHHIIPHLISPIDRQYSMKFLKINQYNNYDEKDYAEIFISGMYKFIEQQGNKLEKYIDDKFNTSLTKIYDNLIMVYIKNKN
jgi:hypothetical protein